MKTVLIVDDNEESIYLLQSILTHNGYQFMACRNGSEALEKLQTNSIDLIISDILMPVMDGFQLCHECKKDDRFKNIPFLFYTATYTDEDDERLSIELGASGFLRKPLSPAQIITKIDQALKEELKQPAQTGNVQLNEKRILTLYNERLINKLEQRNIALEKEIREHRLLKSTLNEKTHELEELTNYLQNIREEERMILSRELHDELGQVLTIIKVELDWLKKHLGEMPETIQTRLDNLFTLNNSAIHSVREIAYRLRPGILDDLGLQAALEWHAKDFENRTNIKTNFHSNINDMKIPESISVGLYRIYQESLTNVMKHSKATEVNSALTFENSSLKLNVNDNGIGFQTKKNESQKSLGLLGMTERVKMLGGKIEIKAIQNEGVRIEAIIPIKT